MHKGLIATMACLFISTWVPALLAEGEIYKVVDENGNVTYTDQRPSSGAQPLNLPPLSVVQTEAPPTDTGKAAAAEGEDAELTPRDLRRMYRDFRIIAPQPEETFWGTANTVVISWGAGQAVAPELSARLYVDGKPQDVPGSGSVSLTLDRGEHQVYAELLDNRKRRIVTTDTVTFFVKQHSVNFNQPTPAPRSVGR